MNIIELMRIPADEHDLAWLKSALQSAIELELATIPPYLCALWSIKEDTSADKYITTSIKEIIIEEMRHMGLACNMLTTLGGVPKMNTSEMVPKYPGNLPGGVKPGLTVSLKKLSKTQLEVFMEIELPETPPLAVLAAAAIEETYYTIGEFYDAILEAFRTLPASAITGTHQLRSGGLQTILTLRDAEAAISHIKKQGEGTAQSPLDSDDETEPDLAHFYRFRELLREHKFIKTPEGKWIDDPLPLPFPAVHNMADIPLGGYPESVAFDRIYTALLNSLQRAWEAGGDRELNRARGIMGSMAEEAQRLMQTPIDENDPGKGNFGPSFLLIV